MGYTVVAEYPHDVRHFTQGLEIHEGKLFESTGGYGSSSVYIKDLKTGAVDRKRSLAPSLFGEGLTILGDQLFMLTWREQIGLVFDGRLNPLRQFPLVREGWGMTHRPTPDGDRLVLSDGSADLYEYEPRSMRQTRVVPVRYNDQPVERLNELEYARGKIYSNIWMTDRIAVIRPADGHVDALLDLTALKFRFAKPTGWDAGDHVLNGIAYDAESEHFFVTGKCWPILFELEIEPAPKVKGKDA